VFFYLGKANPKTLDTSSDIWKEDFPRCIKLTKTKVKHACPEDKTKCDCITVCPKDLSEDCPDKSNPDMCCQGCLAAEEENEE
jgi:hypothetical protein